MKKFCNILAILALLIAPYTFAVPQAQAVNAIVQTKGCNGGGYVNSYTCAFTSNVTGGSLLVLSITASVGDHYSLTDNRGNTWVHVATSTDERKTVMHYVQNAAAGATTVTVQFASGQFVDSATVMREYSGIETTGALDKSAVGDDEGGFVQTHSTDAPTATTAQANELLVAAIGSSGSGDPVFVAGTNYGNLTQQNGFDSFTFGGMIDRTVSATGAYDASFTTTAFVRGQVVLGTFKETVAATPSSGTSTGAIFMYDDTF